MDNHQPSVHSPDFVFSTGNQSVLGGLVTRLDLRVKSELLFSKDTIKTTQIFNEEHFPLTILLAD